MTPPLHHLSAIELVQLIADGQASPETVTRSCIEAIAAGEAQVKAFAWFDADQALAAARSLHMRSRRGPLYGLPIAVKDNIDTADQPTGHGSPVYQRHRPQADAACVALLKEAGALVLGKTAMAELANFTPPATCNPRNPAHTPGGSSSGSAAAVAARFVPVALGTQTAGSVLRPAAFCGVVGWKPSPRLIPRAGVKLNADTLDEVGLFAHTLADTAFVLSVLTGRPAWKELPAQGRTGAAPALGITATAHRNAATPAMLAALSSLEAHLAQRGARLVDLTWPRVFDGLGDAQKTIQVFETARALAAEYLYRRTLLSPPLVALIEQGYACSADEYAAALQLARGCAAAIDSLFGAADVLLAPSAPGIAPAGLSSTGDPIFNRAWQVLGCPAVNLPLPPSIAPWERDLPLGISVVARPGQDAALLGAAAWIEAALAG